MKEDIKEEKVQEEVKEKVVSEEVAPQEEAKKEESKEKKGFFKKKEDQEKIKLQEEIVVLKDKVLRTTAEMQNMRRRMEDEKCFK